MLDGGVVEIFFRWKGRIKALMDSNSGKRVASRLVASKKEKSADCKDNAIVRKQNVQYCDGIGTFKPCQSTNHGVLDKSRYSRPCFGPSNGNKIIRTSSCNNSVIVCSKKTNLDSKIKLTSQLEYDTLPSSSEASKRLCFTCKNPTVYQSKLAIKNSVKDIVTEIGSSSVSSKNSPKKSVQIKSGPQKKNSECTSSGLSVYNSSFQDPSNNCNRHKYGTRNLNCNSVTSVLPNSCSSLVVKSVGKNGTRMRSPEEHCDLSHRGKKTAEELPVDGCVFPSNRGFSIPNTRANSCTKEEVSSGSMVCRTGRSVNVNHSSKISNRLAGVNRSSTREPSTSSSQISDTEVPITVSKFSPLQFSENDVSSGSSSFNPSGGNADTESALMPFSRNDSGLTFLRNFDSLLQDSVDGFVELLLALERIEQNEGMPHEHLHALETSLYLGRLNHYDQHRELRLDIDNMSYEELLDLEERMGTVSTAVSEETLSKCLKRTIYQQTSSVKQINRSTDNEYDTKCSICQDEFAYGDEIGTLVECDHGYHTACIKQWLRVKNWCPVCKSSAAPSHSYM